MRNVDRRNQHLARIRRRILLAGLIGAICAGGCGPDPDSRRLHLVINAGSSGTRLCFFAVQKSCTPDSEICTCRARTHGRAPDCQPIPDAGGLAGMTPAQAGAVLSEHLRNTLTPDLAGRLENAALLGTGGFRQIAPQRRHAILRALELELNRSLGDLNREGGAPDLSPVIRVLSGADEGRLAWRSVRETEDSENHAILETGGASVQFAAGRNGQAHASVSLPLGMNRAFDRLKNKAELPACFPFGTPDARTDFDRCRRLIQRTIFTAPDGDELARVAGSDGRPEVLYGLGSSWKAVFLGMDESEITLSELLHFGRAVCAARKLTEQERSSKYLKRRCFLYAFQSVLLQQTGYDAIRRSRESWPRGAAVSEEFFPICGASMHTIQVP